MLEKIKEILVEQLNCDADSINEDTSFKNDLGAYIPWISTRWLWH